MINYAIGIFIALFAIKSLLTVFTFSSLIEVYKDKNSSSESVSFLPPIEVPIWFAVLLLSTLTKRDHWYNSPLILGIGGFLIILLSYLLAFLVLMVVGIYIRKSGLGKEKEETITRLKELN